MKSRIVIFCLSAMRRAPQGARGLKSECWEVICMDEYVAPRKGRVG